MFVWDKINRDGFFMFDRTFISSGVWAGLPLAAKKVFPVIACHRDRQGIAFPSELTIAVMSGLSVKTAREGIRALEGLPGFDISHYVNARGRHAKKYRIAEPPKEKNRRFPFFRSVVDGGLWALLSGAGAAVYPVMRHFSFVAAEENDGEDFNENYKTRTREYCEAASSVIIENSGISRQGFYEAIDSLKKCNLVDDAPDVETENRTWKIYVRPEKYFKREYLNKLTRERYRHEKCF